MQLAFKFAITQVIWSFIEEVIGCRSLEAKCLFKIGDRDFVGL